MSSSVQMSHEELGGLSFKGGLQLAVYDGMEPDFSHDMMKNSSAAAAHVIGAVHGRTHHATRTLTGSTPT